MLKDVEQIRSMKMIKLKLYPFQFECIMNNLYASNCLLFTEIAAILRARKLCCGTIVQKRNVRHTEMTYK